MPRSTALLKAFARVAAATLCVAGLAQAQAAAPGRAVGTGIETVPTQVAAVDAGRHIEPVRRGELVVTVLHDGSGVERPEDGEPTGGGGTAAMLLATLLLAARVVSQRR